MNTQEQPKQGRSAHLLDTIIAIRADLGEALNDDELTRFLRETALLTEMGFAFLSYSDGYVTLTVPEQNPADWYPEQGWIAPEKEKIARAIAKKYMLLFYEPVDTTSNFHPEAGTAVVHHHLELADRRQTVIVAHPQYLKVCLFGKSPDHRYAWEPLYALALGPELLQDLSLLYHRNPEPNCKDTSNWHPKTKTL